MIILTPKERRIRMYRSRPFKNRKRIEESLKEILDLMDEKKFQEAWEKGMVFLPKLEVTIMAKIERQAQNSKKQDKD